MGLCQLPGSHCWPNGGGIGISNTQLGVTLEGCDCKKFGLTGDNGVAGWDCHKNSNVYEANLMGTPDKCVPRHYPILGNPPQFATKQDCINSACGQIVLNPINP